MTVPYEEMVADPTDMTKRVLSLCGLDYEDGCERIERNAAPVSTASNWQAREPMHARGVGAWEAYAHFLEPMRKRLNDLGAAA